MEFEACYKLLQERAAKSAEHMAEVEKYAPQIPIVDSTMRDDAPEDVSGKPEDPAIEAAIAEINRDFPEKVSLEGGSELVSSGPPHALNGLDSIVSDIRNETSENAGSTFARPDDCQQVRDAMAAIEDERWESADGFYSLPPHKKLLKLEERRVRIQKAFDLVLKRLIAKREVDAGYGRLAKSVTVAFQEVNLKMRELGKELDERLSSGRTGKNGDINPEQDVDMAEGEAVEQKRSPMILGTPEYEANRELRQSIDKILKLQKNKFEQVVAFHAAQIRLYSETIRGSFGKVEDEKARRLHYEEVANLKNVIQKYENDIEEELTEVRYGY